MSQNGVKLQDVLHSVRSEQLSFVKFINVTKNDVTLEWIDFQGHHAKCKKILKPGDKLEVQTFVGHPWVAYNAWRYEMTFSESRDRIFFPKPSRITDGFPAQATVLIMTPCKSLKQICLEKIHQRLRTPNSISILPVPQILKLKLTKMVFKQFNHDLPVKIVDTDD